MTRTHLLLLGLILAFAAAVRAFGLSDLGYWTDELCTLSEAQGHGLQLVDVPTDRLLDPPLPNRTRLAAAAPAWRIVPELAAGDTHPPVYFLLVRVWETAFGDSEAAVRSLDVCFSVAAVPLLFAAARPDVGATAALWACLLMAVASPQVTFAQEARDYVPVLTFSLAAAIAQRRLLDRPTAALAGLLAACLLAMMLTHYYAAGVAVALAAHAALTARGRPLAYAIAAFAVAAAVFGIVWVPSFVRQLPVFGYGDVAWLTDAGSGHRGRAVLNLCRLPVRWVADVRSPAAAAGGVLLLLPPVAWVARPRLRLWVLWAAIPTAAVAATDLARSTVQLAWLRYTFFATPAVYVLVAAAVPRGRWRWAPPAVAVLAAVLALPAAYVPAWKIDLRTPAQTIGRRLGPADGLVVSGPDRGLAAMTFAACQHYLPRVPAAAVVLTRPAGPAVLDRLRQCPHVWVIWMRPDRPIAAFVPGYQTAESGQVPSFGAIAVGHVGVSRPPPR